jgi:hypothetical protein
MPYAPTLDFLSRMTLRSVLCYAYKATSDPAFVAAAKRRQLELNPIYGDELNTLAQEVIAQSADVIERMKQIMGN